MKLHLIFARSNNNVIGRDGAIPWKIPDDLKRFKKLTMGCPVIMGRKTWDSLPEKYKPLSGRLNVVITRQTNWSAVGAQTAINITDALHICEQYDDVWVIGGGEIYKQALPYAHTAEVTEVDGYIYNGDTFGPVLNNYWTEVSREEHAIEGWIKYAFVSYVKKLFK